MSDLELQSCPTEVTALLLHSCLKQAVLQMQPLYKVSFMAVA